MKKLIHQKNALGFTLIELMIVVAILGILAAIAIPQFLIFSGKAKRAEAVYMLRAIHSAETVYFGSYDTYISGSFAASSTVLALGPIPMKYYTQTSQIYGCSTLSCPLVDGHCPIYLAVIEGNLDNDPYTDQVVIQQATPTCPVLGIPNGIATVTQDDLIN